MIDADGLWAAIEARAEASPEALFAVDENDRTLSFREYRDAALRAAAGLAAKGVEPDSIVSWVLPTWLETLVLAGALSRLGAVQNPILPIYRRKEIGFIVEQARPKMLIVPSTWRGFDYGAMAEEIAEASSGLDVLVVDRQLPDGDPIDLPAFDVAEASATRWLFYTSGTTANPKGALHTDAGIFAASRGMSDVLRLTADDRIALVFPFTHVGGVLWLCNGLLTGCAQIAIEAFDPATSIDVLAKHGVTQATAGTAFHQAYLAAQRANPDRKIFPSVRSFPGGGAPKPPQLHMEIKNEMGGAGIISGYGLTECPALSMGSVDDSDEKLMYTEGRVNPASTEVRIYQLDGARAGTGEEGEIRARGSQLCKGYLDSQLNAEAFDADGFFRTGDLGYLDADGYIVITGRLKDVIIRKGENISAKEVEDILYTHPNVADVAVIGLPDAKSGERACAVVVADAAGFTFVEMVQFLKDQGLMLQKIPEQLEIVDALPRNPTGKVLKHELRKRYTAEV